MNAVRKMDIKHYYLEQGQGEPLILLHGNGEDSDYFRGQMEAFSEQYHVYALDTRGHGKTPRGERPFTIRQFAEDLLGFMEVHEIERAHLLGFSDGGNVAMIFAISHPDRVNLLILNGANMNPKGVKARFQIPIEIGYRLAKGCARFASKAVANAELLGLMVNDPNVSREELARIRARTLVIAGKKDMIRESHTRSIAEAIPNSELALLEGDHFVAHKCPDAFNRRVLEFLKKDTEPPLS